jgi:hypothetical protein
VEEALHKALKEFASVFVAEPKGAATGDPSKKKNK